MHFEAKVLQFFVAIAAGILLYQGWQSLFEGSVAVIQPLEFKERIDQRAPFTLRDAHGEEKEHGIVASFFHHDAAGVEKGTDDGGRDAKVLHLAADRDTRRDQIYLDGVEQAVVLCQTLKPVPCCVGLQYPILR